MPHNDALVIVSYIDHVKVQRILVDKRASTNVLSFSTYATLGMKRTQLKKCLTLLVGFVGKIVVPEGCIYLPTLSAKIISNNEGG